MNNEEMSITGTTPAQAYPQMKQQLLERQNSIEVDAVSGATYSLYRFRYALAVALMKARLAAGHTVESFFDH
jgi:major membrane immunogen (membrane-anchored lipoprotein)